MRGRQRGGSNPKDEGVGGEGCVGGKGKDTFFQIKLIGSVNGRKEDLRWLNPLWLIHLIKFG